MCPVNNGVLTYQADDRSGLAARGHGTCAPRL
jgi:hypothetical protein